MTHPVVDYRPQAETLLELGREFHARGWVPATSGNFSARVDAGRVAITVSGRHKARLTTDDIMLVDLDGNSLSPGKRPSAETLLHTALYRRHPEVGSVLHTHSPAATVLSLTVGNTLMLQGYELLKAYRESIDRLMQKYDFQSVDVVSMHPDHPQKDVLRDKFLHEHTHSDFEVRFFVDGEGLFYIRKNSRVYATLCTRGDLISVPANTTHWFDMGPRPFFKAVRLFTTPEGWVADFTGDKIADRFPRLENAG